MRFRTILIASIAAVLSAALVAQAQVPGVNSTLNSVFTLAYDNSTMKATYSASTIFTPAAAATDVCTITGSATKNIRVRRITVSGLAASVVNAPVSFIKRSTANSGGTSSNLTEVGYDSGNSAATATALAYTANPTVGSAVGTVAEVHVSFGNLTTGLGAAYTYNFGQLGSPVVLRGITQVLAVSLNGATYTTPALACTIEWTEE